MKKKIEKFIPVLGILPALIAGSLYAETKAYEGFNVPGNYEHRSELDGQRGGSGFKVWKVDTSAGAGNTRRYIASREAPAYTDAKGNELKTEAGMMQCKSAGAGKGAITRELDEEMTGTFWISFLTKMDSQPGYGWDIQFLDPQGEMQFKVMNGREEQNRWRILSMKHPSGKQKDGLFESKAGMTPTDPTLVILKIQNTGSGSDDGSVTAFLNPVDLRDAELSAMASVKITGLELNAVKTFSFDKKTTAEGYFDELRFGETVEDVLPFQ